MVNKASLIWYPRKKEYEYLTKEKTNQKKNGYTEDSIGAVNNRFENDNTIKSLCHLNLSFSTCSEYDEPYPDLIPKCEVSIR